MALFALCFPRRGDEPIPLRQILAVVEAMLQPLSFNPSLVGAARKPDFEQFDRGDASATGHARRRTGRWIAH